MSRPKNKPKLPKTTVDLRVKVRVGENTLGPGKLHLLRLIDEKGSISGAARDMKIGYRRAQFLLETLQSGFSAPLVITKRGGNGGATLSPTAKTLLAEHKSFLNAMETEAAPFLHWLKAQQPNEQDN